MAKSIDKPTVAHICKSYLPISQTFIYRYLQNFERTIPVILADKIENLDNFPIKRKIYDCSYRKFTLRWFINGLSKKLIGEEKHYNKIILRLSKCRLIHAHFGQVGYSMIDLKQKLKLPLITTFYGYDMSVLPRQELWQKRYEKLFALGDFFLVEGNHMKNSLIDIGCPKEKIGIQHIGIDVDQFFYRKRMPKNNEKVKLLFCGRLTEKKGLIYALLALKRVVQVYPDISFHIVGDGEQRQEIEDFINANMLNNYVEMLGIQPHHIVAQEMANADIFIQPSVTAADGDTEGGAPTILLEAQAAGVPVLATFHADIPEVVVDGKSGLLSQEKNYVQLANNLLYFLTNQNAWPSFGQNGREHVASHYETKKETKNMENHYFQFIN